MEHSIGELVLSGLATEAGKYTFQQLANGASRLWTRVKNAAFPTCAHEELAKLLTEQPDEVQSRIDGFAAENAEFERDLAQLLVEINVSTVITQSQAQEIFSNLFAHRDINIIFNQSQSAAIPQQQPTPARIDNLPPRNPIFTGRESQLDRVYKALVKGKAAALTAVLKGMGGIGKTQIAIEYGYRFRDNYDIIWWVPAEEPAAIPAIYEDLAERLGLLDGAVRDQALAVILLKKWLRNPTQHEKWLLIFDNAVEPDDLEEFLPGAGGHILITSRYSAWRGIVGEQGEVDVDIWPEDEAVEFLHERTGLDEVESSRELANELGCLPLALEQVAAYINRTGCTIQSYLELYKQEHTALFDDELSEPTQRYKDTVLTTWLISFKEIDKDETYGKHARDLMNLCAFLAPDNIPAEILVKTSDEKQEESSGIFDQKTFNHAVALLQDYSLLKRQKDDLFIHRLVQEVVRNNLSKDEQKTWAGLAASVINSAFPQESYDVRTWDNCERLLLHGLAVAEHAKELESNLQAVVRILNQCAIYKWGRAQYEVARDMLVRLLPVTAKAYGEDHGGYASNLSNLGLVLQALGDLSGARANYERALRIDETAFGPDHPNVAIDVNNLGSVLKDLGDLSGAKENFKRALQIDETAFGPDHLNVAIDVNNLGLVLQALGDLSGAKSHYERALQIDETAFGPDHPNVAIRVNNLGSVLQALGDLPGAKENFERALQIDETAFGPDHPNVARDVNNLGSVLKALGDLSGAKENYERALNILTVFLGSDHPNTKVVQDNLARLIEKMKSN